MLKNLVTETCIHLHQIYDARNWCKFLVPDSWAFVTPISSDYNNELFAIIAAEQHLQAGWPFCRQTNSIKAPRALALVSDQIDYLLHNRISTCSCVLCCQWKPFQCNRDHTVCEEEGRVGTAMDRGPEFSVCRASRGICCSRRHLLLRIICCHFLAEEARCDAGVDVQ